MARFLFYLSCALLGFTLYNYSQLTAWTERGIVSSVARLDSAPTGTLILVRPSVEIAVKTKRGDFTLSNFDVNYPLGKNPRPGDCVIVPVRQAKYIIVFDNHAHQVIPCS